MIECPLFLDWMTWFSTVGNGTALCWRVSMFLLHASQVKAMLLEPLCEDTYLAVDGESVPLSPVYVEVHPSLCSVCVSPDYENL